MQPDQPPLNPFAPTVPASAETSSGDAPKSEASIRREHLRHEESIKSVGAFLMIAGSICGILLIVTAFLAPFDLADNDQGIWNQQALHYLSMMLIYGCLGSVSIYCGRGLRRFSHGGRVIATIFCTFVMLVPPFGTAMSIYGLWLLYGQKGRFVFGDHYQYVIARTPEIQFKSSFIVNAFAVLLIAVFLGQMGLILLLDF